MPLLKKIILSFFVFLLLIPYSLFLTPSPAHAQQTWYSQDFGDWYLRVYKSPANDVFGERYTSAQIQWIFYGLAGHILNATVGVVGIKPSDVACVIEKSKTSLLGKVANFTPPVIKETLKNLDVFGILLQCGFSGLIDRIKNFKILGDETTGTKKNIAESIFLTERPLSGIAYFRNTLQNLHLIPEAKAQAGFGFGALNPILLLWKASRNVAYAVLVFAILILSFMVMFRVKINPQTVITVQSAIPKVVIALILITFSYAIAGLLVDLMYVVLGLLSLVFSQFSIAVLKLSPSQFFDLMTIGPGGTGILGVLTVYFLPVIIIDIVLVVIGLIFSESGFGIILVLVGVILFIVMFVFFLRVVWLLFKTFAYIILLVSFAPIQIAFGILVPSLGFGQWLKSMVSNLAVFVVVDLFFALSAILMLSPFVSPSSSTPGWPPLLNLGDLGPSGNFGTSVIFFGVSLAIFAAIPKVADIIKSLIEGKPFAYGTAIGEAVVGPLGALGTGFYQTGRVAETIGKLAEDWPQNLRTVMGRLQRPPAAGGGVRR